MSELEIDIRADDGETFTERMDIGPAQPGEVVGTGVITVSAGSNDRTLIDALRAEVQTLKLRVAELTRQLAER